MHKLLTIGLSVLLPACGTMGGFFGGGAEPAAELSQAEAPAGFDARGLGVYLEMMRTLAEGDAVQQAETFADVERAAAVAPTTTNRLKLALAHCVPNHAASDPGEAAAGLAALLAEGSSLLPEERMLATIHLHEAEQRLMLDAVADRLRSAAAEARELQNAEQARRLEAALAENRRLRAELEEALAKLEAITSIEQSIRERENDAN